MKGKAKFLQLGLRPQFIFSLGGREGGGGVKGLVATLCKSENVTYGLYIMSTGYVLPGIENTGA